MKTEHKVMLVSIMAALQSLEDRYQIRSEGEQTFKAAKVDLQKLIDLPEVVETVPEVVPSVVNEADEIFKATVLEKLEGFEDVLGVLVAALPEPETAPEEAPAV